MMARQVSQGSVIVLMQVPALASVPRLRRAALGGVLGASREMGVEQPESVFRSVRVPRPGAEQGGMLEASPARGTTTRRMTVLASAGTGRQPCPQPPHSSMRFRSQ